jgi:hypothetical protein
MRRTKGNQYVAEVLISVSQLRVYLNGTEYNRISLNMKTDLSKTGTRTGLP